MVLLGGAQVGEAMDGSYTLRHRACLFEGGRHAKQHIPRDGCVQPLHIAVQHVSGGQGIGDVLQCTFKGRGIARYIVLVPLFA